MKLRIKHKIIFSTASVIALILLITGIVEYNYFSTILKEELVEKDQVMVSQSATHIGYIQDEILRFSHFIIIDQEIQRLLKESLAEGITEAERVLLRDRIEREMQKHLSSIEYIDSVSLVGRDGGFYSTNWYLEAYVDDDWFNRIDASGKRYTFSEPYTAKTVAASIDLISFIHTFIDMQTGDVLGSLIINMNHNQLNKLFANAFGEFQTYAIINSNNEVILENGEFPQGMTYDAMNTPVLESEDGFIYTNDALDDDWRIMTFKSYQSVFQRLDNIYLFVIFSILFGLLAIILINTTLISSITNPISNLSDAMGRVSKGDLDVAVTCTSGDEIELLSDGFNKMLIDLKHHIDDSIEHEKTTRQMQIDLLISQINPHFIYNTLNCITYMIRKNRNKDAEAMVEAFISILQDTIKIGEEGTFAQVSKEIEIIRNYIMIQKFRYPDRFEVLWDVDGNLLGREIPRSIIQPIIENAIYHGIYANEEMGIIRITIKRDLGRIWIIIEDNGMGMGPDKLKEIMSGDVTPGSSSKMKSIGIKNIRERLSFIYSDEGSLEIESEEGKGTRVSISFVENTEG